jgi:hypothetical protein
LDAEDLHGIGAGRMESGAVNRCSGRY